MIWFALSIRKYQDCSITYHGMGLYHLETWKLVVYIVILNSLALSLDPSLTLWTLFDPEFECIQKVSESGYHLNETRGITVHKICRIWGGTIFDIIKNMSSSGGISKANPKLGVKNSYEDHYGVKKHQLGPLFLYCSVNCFHPEFFFSSLVLIKLIPSIECYAYWC